MKSIDLNADLGEGMAFDDELMNIVSSASIACGGHAGDEQSMKACLLAAKKAGIVTGAHPGFVDKENFGRLELDLPHETIRGQVMEQIGRLVEIGERVGQRISYVKLHGALYNLAARDHDLSWILFSAIREFDPSLAILALDGSAQFEVAGDLGFRVIGEAFADRAYEENGQLVSRTQPGAVYHDPALAVAQSLDIATRGVIRSIGGKEITSRARSICLHGDNHAALELARAVRAGLEGEGVEICSPLGQGPAR